MVAVTEPDTSDTKRRLLVISNGHGEDDIACKVVACLHNARPETLEIEAWPMVGEGQAYYRHDVPTVGPKNTLPSAGFATLDWRLMADDLKGGWIGTHWRQYLFVRAIRGRYDAIIGVGDVIPLLVSRLSGIPMFFVACAKSAYYEPGDGYTRTEKRLMRRCCLAVFPRDRLTSTRLQASGVANEYLGNPMMDGLEPDDGLQPVRADETGIALLPGSRQDSADNLLLLLRAASKIATRHERPASLAFAVAAHQALPLAELRRTIMTETGEAQWLPASPDTPGRVEDDELNFVHRAGSRLLIAKDRFAEILHGASLAIGMAGTANEQAIGLGVPLLAVPSTGVQGKNYVRMKMKFFGESAVMAASEPENMAGTALSLLQDKAACHRMAAAGRERMGPPGASKAIADRIQAFLDSGRLPRSDRARRIVP